MVPQPYFTSIRANPRILNNHNHDMIPDINAALTQQDQPPKKFTKTTGHIPEGAVPKGKRYEKEILGSAPTPLKEGPFCCERVSCSYRAAIFGYNDVSSIHSVRGTAIAGGSRTCLCVHL